MKKKVWFAADARQDALRQLHQALGTFENPMFRNLINFLGICLASRLSRICSRFPNAVSGGLGLSKTSNFGISP